jgi:hypothetical protein
MTLTKEYSIMARCDCLGQQVLTADDACEWAHVAAESDEEWLVALFLNEDDRIIGFYRPCIGETCACDQDVDARAIFAQAWATEGTSGVTAIRHHSHEGPFRAEQANPSVKDFYEASRQVRIRRLEYIVEFNDGTRVVWSELLQRMIE